MMKKALAFGMILIMVAVVFTMMANVLAEDQDPDWAVTYNGIQNRYDYGYDCAVDANGNVFVVGNGYESSTSYYDIVTLKYDASGNLLWKRSFNGVYGRSDYGAACTVDPQGNVYVCGRGYMYSYNYDYIVIKYDANGNQIWMRSYNGPGGSSDYIYYYGQPIRYDNGRVFVTGYSYGSGTSYDIATISYDANTGFQYWVRRYHGGYSSDYGRSLDVWNGNVYVAGYTYTSSSNRYDYVTICYNQMTGAQLWVSKFHNGYSYDYGYDVAVDDSTGMVYTTGYGYWGSSTNSYNINTVAYNGLSGAQLWVKTFHGGYSSDYGRGVETDDAGNVYVTGYAYWDQPGEPYTNHRTDIAVINYDGATGAQKWVANYNGPRSSYSYEYSYGKPALDPTTGNIVVVGRGDGPTDTYEDMLVLVYSKTGSETMVGRYSVPHVTDSVYVYGGPAIDADGNIFAVGYHDADASTYYDDIITAKWGSSIPATVEMDPKSLNLDSNGNWVSFKVDSFPENPEFGPLDVDPTSCAVAGVNADLKFGTANNNHYIGKADRLLVEDAIGAPGEEVEVQISGKLTTGKSFKGIATIKAILN